LGKYIVDGGMTLRFSPYHPTRCYKPAKGHCTEGDANPFLCPRPAQRWTGLLHRRWLQPAETARQRGGEGRFAELHCLYLRPLRPGDTRGLYPGGRKVITFANILQHDVFPRPASCNSC
jgi:hypothetical protein